MVMELEVGVFVLGFFGCGWLFEMVVIVEVFYVMLVLV